MTRVQHELEEWHLQSSMMVGRRKGYYKREWVAKTVGIAVTRRFKKHTNTRIHYNITHFHTSHFVDSHSYHQVVAETEYRMSRK